ncbi:MAG: GntR family transcriptional regulator [Corynebacterium sp.]|nr:GntR family transcriptional regulator [Corynebacterium sp.]
MQAKEADPRPIYVQIAEDLKSMILSGELSEFYQVNPTTAAKAMTELSMVGLVEKKRGLGMFVTPDARERIRAERREAFQRTYIEPLKAEAGILGLTLHDIIAMLEEEK